MGTILKTESKLKRFRKGKRSGKVRERPGRSSAFADHCKTLENVKQEKIHMKQGSNSDNHSVTIRSKKD